MGFTGGQQSVTVPAGVYSARVFLSGAQGGNGTSGNGNAGGAGGRGARVEGAMTVTPGEVLSVWVGGQGSQAVNPGGLGGAGRNNGSRGASGGGATDIRQGGSAVSNRVAIAAGGGGGGSAGWGGTTQGSIVGGNGGDSGAAGGDGVDANSGANNGPFRGGGGVLGAGGAAGAGCGTYPATSGAASGEGGGTFSFAGGFQGNGAGGGGGGGAVIGGGGGGAGVGTTGCLHNWTGSGGGGAGGTSDVGTLLSPLISQGAQGGDGAALICMAAPRYQMGGTVSGATGALQVALTSSSPSTVQTVTVGSGVTSFAFPTLLNGGATWSVDVTAAPAGQVCTVTPASGTNLTADTQVSVTCATVAIAIEPATLPAATYNVAYSQTLTASSVNGGLAPYTFDVTTGALPAGTALAPDGTLSGTSAATGTASFTVRATSSNGFSGTHAYTLDVIRAAQAITDFVANPATPTLAPNATFAISATGGASGNAVSFGTTTSTICTVSGSTVTMLAAGNCVLTADQAGDANHDAAPQATLTVAIGAGSQVITGFAANPVAPIYAPNGTFALSATGGPSGSPVVYASTTPAVCSVSGATVTMLAAGNCGLTADQAGDGNYQAAAQVALQVNIGQAAPTIEWVADLLKTVGEAAFDLTDPSSNSPGAFTFTSSNSAVATVSGRTVTIVGAGVTTLVATQAATSNYTQGEASITLTVAVRPDPTKERSVVTGLQAQVDASVRFADAQQANIRDRLRQLRQAGGDIRSHNGLNVSVANASGDGMALPVQGDADALGAHMPHGWGVWTAGTVSFGERGGTGRSNAFDFRSDGVSVGVDRRWGEHGVLGIAGGFGWHDTDFDDGGSELKGDQRSLTAYALWQGDRIYVDGLLGWGRLDFDIARRSEIIDATGHANREGDQFFASLSVGHEYRSERATVTGYGRLDASRTTLDAYRETGLGIYDLVYREHTIRSETLAIGVEGSHPRDWGSRTFRPFWSIEFRDALRNEGTAALNYVIQPVASDYVLGMESYAEHLGAFTAGFDLELAAGWQMSLMYRREQSSHFTSDSVGLWLAFGGRGANAGPRANGDAQAQAATGK